MKTSKPVFLFLAIAIAGSSMAQNGSTSASNTSNFTLLCRANAYGQVSTVILAIDYSRNTVNAAKALVTENMITWSTNEYNTVAKTNRINLHELNRLAGTYRNWEEGAVYPAPLPTFLCEKAPAAKF